MLRWRLGDLDRRPPLESLTDDPVYRDFVALGLQRARAAAAQAREAAERVRAKQAERERLAERARTAAAEARKATERARAERLTDRLRALGIEPD